MTANEYRATVRRQYELSKALKTERDLDARLAIYDEQAAVSAAALASTLPAAERAAICAEEFTAAYPTLHLTTKRTAPDRGRWGRRQAALR